MNVMLAKNYGDYPIEFPCWSQPKLDGMRMRLDRHGAWTRTGKVIHTMPHVIEEFKWAFKDNPDLILDGEIYNHDLKHNFNKLMSLARKTKPTKEDLEECKSTLQYHVYDCQLGLPFIERYDVYRRPFHGPPGEPGDIVHMGSPRWPMVQLVPTAVVQTQERLDELYEAYLSYGYEGQMIRTSGPYKHGRSKTLLKRKELMDDEFLIVDVVEGEGKRAGKCGHVLLQTASGQRFGADPLGTDEDRTIILQYRLGMIGQMGTVQFNGYTPGGIPRFAKFKCVRPPE